MFIFPVLPRVAELQHPPKLALQLLQAGCRDNLVPCDSTIAVTCALQQEAVGKALRSQAAPVLLARQASCLKQV